MEFEVGQYVFTRNQLLCSDVAAEDARCSPTDVGQEKMSPSSQSPTEPPICGRVASASLLKQNTVDYPVLQGIHYEAELETFMHIQTNCLLQIV